MYSNNPWRKEEWFIQQFIYEGKSINEMAKEFNVNWSSLERWRKIYNLPKHSDKVGIIEKFGIERWQKIDRRKRARYSVANKIKADKLVTNKTLNEMYGEDKANIIKQKLSAASKNIK